MAGLRKGKCYTRIKRAFTRKSKYKSKSYVKGIPPSKIARFESGNPHGDYPYQVDLVALKPVQLRHNALESSRQVITRRLDKYLSRDFLIKLRAHPHHILRENKILSGAQSDRMSTGMAHSYGRPIGVAAQIPKGTVVFSVYVKEEHIEKAKEALKMAPARLPGSYTIVSNKRK